MSKSEREGRTLIVTGLLIGVLGLLVYFTTPYAIGLFISGVGFTSALGTHGALRQRRFWNERFGRDVWDDGK